MTFHIRNGWTAERLAGSGGVTIGHGPGENDEPGQYITMTDTEWASVVASVCAQGEAGTTYNTALAFHNDEGKGIKAPSGERVDEPTSAKHLKHVRLSEHEDGQWQFQPLGDNGEPQATSEPYVSAANAKRGAHDLLGDDIMFVE